MFTLYVVMGKRMVLLELVALISESQGVLNGISEWFPLR